MSDRFYFHFRLLARHYLSPPNYFPSLAKKLTPAQEKFVERLRQWIEYLHLAAFLLPPLCRLGSNGLRINILVKIDRAALTRRRSLPLKKIAIRLASLGAVGVNGSMNLFEDAEV